MPQPAERVRLGDRLHHLRWPDPGIDQPGGQQVRTGVGVPEVAGVGGQAGVEVLADLPVDRRCRAGPGSARRCTTVASAPASTQVELTEPGVGRRDGRSPGSVRQVSSSRASEPSRSTEPTSRLTSRSGCARQTRSGGRPGDRRAAPAAIREWRRVRRTTPRRACRGGPGHAQRQRTAQRVGVRLDVRDQHDVLGVGQQLGRHVELAGQPSRRPPDSRHQIVACGVSRSPAPDAARVHRGYECAPRGYLSRRLPVTLPGEPGRFLIAMVSRLVTASRSDPDTAGTARR